MQSLGAESVRITLVSIVGKKTEVEPGLNVLEKSAKNYRQTDRALVRTD